MICGVRVRVWHKPQLSRHLVRWGSRCRHSVADGNRAVFSGQGSMSSGGLAVTSYRPMTLAGLAVRLARTADSKLRWKLVWEFLEEYRWEPDDMQPTLVQDEPPATGDERWDTLLAALAEHLAAQHDLAPPDWADLRVLRRPWFPAELAVQRADALVWAPTAFRKHGVYLSAKDLVAA
jgi:hypothetical protein